MERILKAKSAIWKHKPTGKVFEVIGPVFNASTKKPRPQVLMKQMGTNVYHYMDEGQFITTFENMK